MDTRGAEFPIPLAWSCQLGVIVVSKMRVIHGVVHRFRNSSVILNLYEKKEMETSVMISTSGFNQLLETKLCNVCAPTWQLKNLLIFCPFFQPSA